ncbi:hypothetical protein DY000_02002620 [Brassica cretica]|uniref:Uncharacterized protein n=1 Tax=Brassica cretica TaxID=69181 RepID=A0ABQ7C401_BRACR|nr:hypothetical protein DY000_02002620 [Brassica cretica]
MLREVLRRVYLRKEESSSLFLSLDDSASFLLSFGDFVVLDSNFDGSAIPRDTSIDSGSLFLFLDESPFLSRNLDDSASFSRNLDGDKLVPLSRWPSARKPNRKDVEEGSLQHRIAFSGAIQAIE